MTYTSSQMHGHTCIYTYKEEVQKNRAEITETFTRLLRQEVDWVLKETRCAVVDLRIGSPDNILEIASSLAIVPGDSNTVNVCTDVMVFDSNGIAMRHKLNVSIGRDTTDAKIVALVDYCLSHVLRETVC